MAESIKLADAQVSNLQLTITYLKADGTEGAIDDVMPLGSSNEAIAMPLDHSPDGKMATFELHPAVGAAQLSGGADADMGDGVRPVTWTFDIEITEEEVQSVNVAMTLIPKSNPAPAPEPPPA